MAQPLADLKLLSVGWRRKQPSPNFSRGRKRGPNTTFSKPIALHRGLKNAGVLFPAVSSRFAFTFIHWPITVIQTLHVEALDHFLFFGQKHLDYVVSKFAGFYNERRPHQSKENLPLPVANGPPAEERPEPVASIPLSEVRCKTQLGGLLKHYYRQAA